MKKIITMALALAVMTSCANKEFADAGDAQPQEIKLTSGIASRVSGNQWMSGDKIGVYAVNLKNINSFNCQNVCYSADQSGSNVSFSVDADSSPLYDEMKTGLLVDAYYPYNESNNSHYTNLIIDISDQTDLAANDFMVAKAEVEFGEYLVNLNFERKMSKVVFTIEADNSIASLDALSFSMENAQIKGLPTTQVPQQNSANTTMGTISNVVIDHSADNKSAEIEMILFSTGVNYATKATLNFSLNGKTYSAPFEVHLTANKNHAYKVLMGSKEVVMSGATVTDWQTSEEGDIEF